MIDPDRYWYTLPIAHEVATATALRTGIRQRLRRCDPYDNPYAANWQITPVDTPPEVNA